MKHAKLILGVLCLLAGCAIYLVFRSDTINLYRWCHATIGTAALDTLRQAVHGWKVPFFVKYSLPDGLYCASYILLADSIWDKEKGLWKHAVVAAIPTVAIVHECLQGVGLARGSFDPGDLLAYSLPLLAYFAFVLLQQRK